VRIYPLIHHCSLGVRILSKSQGSHVPAAVACCATDALAARKSCNLDKMLPTPISQGNQGMHMMLRNSLAGKLGSTFDNVTSYMQHAACTVNMTSDTCNTRGTCTCTPL
jgi:hypothetical protein